MDEARQLAHDVRATIHAARMAAAMLRQEGQDGPAMDALEAALAEAALLVAPNTPPPADTQAIAEEVVAALRGRDPAARIDIEALPVVDASPSRVRRVLQNLVSNALTYAGSGCHVRIYHDAGIHVLDDGPGFGAALASQGEHRGLAACRGWAALDGGSLDILPGPGGHVVVRWPGEARGPEDPEDA